MTALLGAGHVEDLREDTYGARDNTEFVDGCFLFGELVKSADGIEPERVVSKLLPNFQAFKGVLLDQEVLLDLEI